MSEALEIESIFEPLRLDPVNAWTATLIMVIALDLNRPREIPRKGNPGRVE